jgi:hypothetical protein
MSDDDNDDEHGNIGEERRSAYVKVSCLNKKLKKHDFMRNHQYTSYLVFQDSNLNTLYVFFLSGMVKLLHSELSVLKKQIVGAN